jgi:hypothetical protein
VSKLIRQSLPKSGSKACLEAANLGTDRRRLGKDMTGERVLRLNQIPPDEVTEERLVRNDHRVLLDFRG